jgi:hypothetical protein
VYELFFVTKHSLCSLFFSLSVLIHSLQDSLDPLSFHTTIAAAFQLDGRRWECIKSSDAYDRLKGLRRHMNIYRCTSCAKPTQDQEFLELSEWQRVEVPKLMQQLETEEQVVRTLVDTSTSDLSRQRHAAIYIMDASRVQPTTRLSLVVLDSANQQFKRYALLLRLGRLEASERQQQIERWVQLVEPHLRELGLKVASAEEQQQK